ncbi:MAG TPA: hypothetical protein VN455_13240 [Methanotrichaceae archaeon]|nr:hypothetical protein [Methanotrichaceae archaeon]
MAFGIVLIVVFGLVYWRSNLVQKLTIIQHAYGPNPERHRASTLDESMYFSAMMFLTRPPCGLHPVGRYLIVLVYVLGWLIMALFLVTLARMIVS